MIRNYVIKSVGPSRNSLAYQAMQDGLLPPAKTDIWQIGNYVQFDPDDIYDQTPFRYGEIANPGDQSHWCTREESGNAIGLSEWHCYEKRVLPDGTIEVDTGNQKLLVFEPVEEMDLSFSWAQPCKSYLKMMDLHPGHNPYENLPEIFYKPMEGITGPYQKGVKMFIKNEKGDLVLNPEASRLMDWQEEQYRKRGLRPNTPPPEPPKKKGFFSSLFGR